MDKNERKLKIELIPDGCWKYNLRTVLPEKLWNFVKKDAKNSANGKCDICGKETRRLEAHERWEYDGNLGIIKLVDVIAICPDCHKAIHMARTHVACDEKEVERIENHYMSVNNCSYSEYRSDLGKAIERQKELNKVSEWQMDLSYLKKYTK